MTLRYILVFDAEKICKKILMGKENKRKNKLGRGHLDTLSARDYFGNGKERLSRRMVTSDWQLTVLCLLHSAHFFFFLFYSFAPFSLLPASPPFTSRTACLLALAAAPKFNLSLTEVLLMFNPFRVLRWENQSQAGWAAGRGGAARGREKENKAVLPAAT